MENPDSYVLDLARKIVDDHGQNHVNEFYHVGVKNKDDLVNHIYDTLRDDKTAMIRCENGGQSTNAGVCFAYNKETNTMLVFHPDKNDYSHTAYCPKDGENRFAVKVKNVTKDQSGRVPEIKHGIYELMPELKREAKPENRPTENQRQAEATSDRDERRERLLKAMQQEWQNEQSHTRDYGRTR